MICKVINLAIVLEFQDCTFIQINCVEKSQTKANKSILQIIKS